MSKQSVHVTFGRAVQLTAPGMLGRRFDFSPGYSFPTKDWHYPGELDEQIFRVGELATSGFLGPILELIFP